MAPRTPGGSGIAWRSRRSERSRAAPTKLGSAPLAAPAGRNSRRARSHHPVHRRAPSPRAPSPRVRSHWTRNSRARNSRARNNRARNNRARNNSRARDSQSGSRRNRSNQDRSSRTRSHPPRSYRVRSDRRARSHQARATRPWMRLGWPGTRRPSAPACWPPGRGCPGLKGRRPAWRSATAYSGCPR
jgi:hypothetical protein